MSDYVQVQGDGSGKKVETLKLTDQTDTTTMIYRQVVTLGDKAEEDIAQCLWMILEELKESRRVICEIARVKFEELPKDKI